MWLAHPREVFLLYIFRYIFFWEVGWSKGIHLAFDVCETNDLSLDDIELLQYCCCSNHSKSVIMIFPKMAYSNMFHLAWLIRSFSFFLFLLFFFFFFFYTKVLFCCFFLSKSMDRWIWVSDFSKLIICGKKHEAVLILLGPGKIHSGPGKAREKSWNCTNQNEWEPVENVLLAIFSWETYAIFSWQTY